MASYPSCRECGADLTSNEEQEQELCFECQDQQLPEKICQDGTMAIEKTSLDIIRFNK